MLQKCKQFLLESKQGIRLPALVLAVCLFACAVSLCLGGVAARETQKDALQEEFAQAEESDEALNANASAEVQEEETLSAAQTGSDGEIASGGETASSAETVSADETASSDETASAAETVSADETASASEIASSAETASAAETLSEDETASLGETLSADTASALRILDGTLALTKTQLCFFELNGNLATGIVQLNLADAGSETLSFMPSEDKTLWACEDEKGTKLTLSIYSADKTLQPADLEGENLLNILEGEYSLVITTMDGTCLFAQTLHLSYLPEQELEVDGTSDAQSYADNAQKAYWFAAECDCYLDIQVGDCVAYALYLLAETNEGIRISKVLDPTDVLSTGLYVVCFTYERAD